MEKQQLVDLLANTKGSTLAQIETLTPVSLSAANKKAGVEAYKRTNGSVVLFNNLKDSTDPYVNRVLKSIERAGGEVVEWQKGKSWWHHTAECYSLAKHNTKDDYYIALHWNDSTVEFLLNGKVSNRKTVASFMTPSGAKELLDDSGVVFNVTNQVEVSDFIRVVKLENVVKLTAKKQTIM
jgi:hypothetical protein